ncbi:hypothetical protein SAMN05660964_03651 [Thiothrix caldifontis]|uniref:Uncharacterized protein n=1 Tax=Thiothrix caldifontis TaxID=525918 RepID=A0A1H4GQR5_9GAMM|nr:hypothetical protein [Thiothrix caldifontis]SEB11884.1 hypothetical protein SAMN05660964_03651 [Thiothrix caldifontis]
MSGIDDAFQLYKEHIFDEKKLELLKVHNLKVTGSVPSVMWELFGAILTGRSSTGVTGADLAGWEIKSAKMGASYEYQYHLNTGAHKLDEDAQVNHLFCAYSETYTDVVVIAMQGQDLANYFDQWKLEYQQNYDTSVPSTQRRQRFRRSIPAGFVKSQGRLVMRIQNGALVERNDTVINTLNRLAS